jgi:hypothetical protein
MACCESRASLERQKEILMFQRSMFALVVVVAVGCSAEPAPDGVETVQRMIVAPGGCGAINDDATCTCNDPNFTGQCYVWRANLRFFMNLSLVPYNGFNDRITSIFVGPAGRAKVCQNPGGAGSCRFYVGAPGTGTAVSNLFAECAGPGVPPGTPCFNDSISSIRVDAQSDDCFAPPLSTAAIFEHPNFGGDCVLLRVGGYPHPFWNHANQTTYDGGGYGLNTDVISSIKVGPFTQISLFHDPQYTGGAAFYTSDVAQLPGGVDNLTSSILVAPTGN